jgi:hypothetical protein
MARHLNTRRPEAAEVSAVGGDRDSMQRASRAGLAALFALAVANGVFLYFVPGRAEPDYAWPIAPPLNAAFLGAGYLAGCVTAGIALRASRWRSARSLVWPLALLSAVLLAATLIHADRFRWDYPPTWAWTLVYVAIPPGAAFLWRRQERTATAPPAHDSRLRSVRRLSWPLGLVLALFGATLVATPQAVLDTWPWEITPLLGRAFGSWYLLMGTMLLIAGSSARRAHEFPIPYLWVGLWSALLLPLPLLYGSTVRAAGASLAVGVAVHVITFALCATAVLRAVVLMRGEGSRL